MSEYMMMVDEKTKEPRTCVDVVMLTKDSLLPCLREALQAIGWSANRANVSARLIIVDKASSDGTHEEVMRHEELSPSIISDDNGTRATARQLGIEAIETELFAFIDSDVVISDDWFYHMLEAMRDPAVGAVWGVTMPRESSEIAYRKALTKVYRMSSIEMSLKYAAKRGLTHDTMIRTSTVKGIQIPSEFHVWEDHFIRLHIEKQGYLWHNSEDAIAFHNRHERVGRDAYLDAYYGHKLGVWSRGWFLKHLFLWPAKLLYLAMATRNRKLIRTEAIKEWNFAKAAGRILKEVIKK